MPQASQSQRPFWQGGSTWGPHDMKVSDLKPEMAGFSMLVRRAREVTFFGWQRADDPRFVAETVVGDETGVISMRCTAEQANVLAMAEVVSIVNGRIQIYQGRMKLEVDKGGSIEAVSSTRPMFVNTSVDVSSVEYELVLYPH